jgi:ABC-type phosphate/phosphonate transport system substrate-binding protein
MGKRYPAKLLLPTLKGFFLVLLTSCSLFRDVQAGETDKSLLKIGFSSKAFVSVPKEDMRIAVQVLSQKIAKKTVGNAESRVYENESDIEKALKAKNLDVVALTSEEFIHLKGPTRLEPVMVTVAGKSPELELILLARRENGINHFRDLKNRVIAIPGEMSQYGSINRIWMETLVMKEGGVASETFSSVKETRGASQAVMMAFFRKADGCIVSKSAFEVASELNPQLSRELRAIASIGKLTGGIVALRQDLPEERKQKVRKALSTLHEDPEGKQMFVLFQLTRLEEFRPELLKATEAMLAEYRELRENRNFSALKKRRR